jgi:hypothetical protein
MLGASRLEQLEQNLQALELLPRLDAAIVGRIQRDDRSGLRCAERAQPLRASSFLCRQEPSALAHQELEAAGSLPAQEWATERFFETRRAAGS